MSKFMEGDKVYFNTGTSYGSKVIKGLGTIRNVRTVSTGGYYVTVNSFIQAPKNFGNMDEVIVSEKEGGVIEHEAIYNSPLYQALL